MSSSANHPSSNNLAKYGSWAVIAGASDGTGAEFARQFAAAGIHLLLVSRRQAALDTLAAELRSTHSIETRVLALDLYAPDAARRMFAAAADIEVGMYVSNAGADRDFSPILDRSLESVHQLIQFNVLTVVDACHLFLAPMRARRRGGAIIMTSVSGLVGGQPGSGPYSATKAFELVYAESLNAELKRDNIDVIGVAAPPMSTPTGVGLLEAAGVATPAVVAAMYRPADVVSATIAQLGAKPSCVFDFLGVDVESGQATADARHARMRAVEAGIVRLFGLDKA